jgi:hypothetical protein
VTTGQRRTRNVEVLLMCHIAKNGDGCHAKGVGGCGGNLLQANVSGRGAKKLTALLRYNVGELRAVLKAANAMRRVAG